MIAVVAGARPNFVKLAPILREMERRNIATQYVHTMQHEGVMDLSEELGMRHPDLLLPHTKPGDLDSIAMALTKQWARLPQPIAVVVVGDVTSTLAAALAATAHGIPVVHVEAGLRSHDWDMPEERNRAVVDRLSDLLLCPDERSTQFVWEDIPSSPAEQPWVPPNWNRKADRPWRMPRAVTVGNVMIDSLRWAEARIVEDDMRADPTKSVIVSAGEPYRGGLPMAATPEKPYALVTIHRPSNVDTGDAWARTLRAVMAIRDQLPVLWVAHPRARDSLHGLNRDPGSRFAAPAFGVIDPQPYVEMVRLMKQATLVATDSGGVQEETTALGIPCLTLRENTERPITVEVGTNLVVGLDPARIGEEVRKILGGAGKRGKIPEGWDGHAADRIVDAIQRRYF